MTNQILLTKTGYEKLQKELEELRGPVRQNIADHIREAKSHGDLKENAAYHEAKLNQKRLESRIADIEKVLQIAKIVERPESSELIAHLGSKVQVQELATGYEMEVTLVGSFESDPLNDLISITSPLGSSLLGKVVGDEFEVEAPAGKQVYKIIEII